MNSYSRIDKVASRYAVAVAVLSPRQLSKLVHRTYRCALCGHLEQSANPVRLREQARRHARSHV